MVALDNGVFGYQVTVGISPGSRAELRTPDGDVMHTFFHSDDLAPGHTSVTSGTYKYERDDLELVIVPDTNN